ncbi:glycosyltransferase [Bacillus sp. JCM 19034]|uniref:CgeB family protein n=1 Tax=Bacillus sp. JCM 19034 TaxID=1481928 RepID=UPI000780DA3D|nr:glycosyltransferase [Bacillus sp. JCM 19034]
MKLLFVSSGNMSFSNLDENIIHGFQEIETNHLVNPFHFHHPILQSIEDVHEQLNKNKPDIVLVLKRKLPIEWIQLFQQHRIPVGLWVVDDPYLIKVHLSQGKPYDFLITQEINGPAFYANKGMKAYYLPLAVNETIYFPKKVDRDYQSDICFVGSGMPNRIRLFQQLTDYFKDKKITIIGRWWEPLKKQVNWHRKVINKTIKPEETSRYYSGAKIVLNIHRQSSDKTYNPFPLKANTPNNRTFDIAACRAFQLSSFRKSMSDFYGADEIVQYYTPNDLVEKLEYYLTNHEEREAISHKAYERTLYEHTYVHRMKQLIALLRENVLHSAK